MSRFARRALLGLLTLGAVGTCFAASPAIGLVVANGSFQLDHSSVRGSATLFDGNVIETNVSSSQLQLNNGVTLRLAAQTRARVYETRLVLEKGIGQLESTKYRIEAASLHVEADKPGATARVQMRGPNRVVVAARDGSVHVSNSDGVLIARLNSGHEMTFEPQESGIATKVSGILAIKGGKFIVVDRTTNVTMQVQGTGLEAEVGNLVEITGTVDAEKPTVPGASQVIDVTSVRRLTKSKREAAAAGAGAAGAGTAGAAAGGLSTGAIVAIVGGVAAAGTVGGLAIAHDLPGQGSSQPSTSR
jgi:hypothetical protein